MFDLKNNVKILQSISPADRINGAVNGTAISTQNFGSACFVLEVGTVGVAATLAWTIEESANGSTGWEAVPSTRLIGSCAAGAANTTQIVGVNDVGGLTKSYLRPVVTVTADTDITVGCSVVALLGNPKTVPVGVSESVYIA